MRDRIAVVLANGILKMIATPGLRDRLKAVYTKGLESDEIQDDHARYRRKKKPEND